MCRPRTCDSGGRSAPSEPDRQFGFEPEPVSRFQREDERTHQYRGAELPGGTVTLGILESQTAKSPTCPTVTSRASRLPDDDEAMPRYAAASAERSHPPRVSRRRTNETGRTPAPAAAPKGYTRQLSMLGFANGVSTPTGLLGELTGTQAHPEGPPKSWQNCPRYASLSPTAAPSPHARLWEGWSRMPIVALDGLNADDQRASRRSPTLQIQRAFLNQ